MALCSTNDVKTYIYGSTTPTTFDTLIGALITQIEAVIEEETGIRAVSTAYDTILDEICDSFGKTKFKVKYQPVRSIVSVYKRDSSWGWEEYTDESASDMEYNGNTVYTQYVVASEGRRNMKINYTVGYCSAKTVAGISGNILTTDALMTGITDTSELVVGMTIAKTAGTGALTGTPTIVSIDSATQITMSAVAATSGTLTATFAAGNEVPADLKLCAILMVAGLLNQRNNIGFQSQSILGLSLQLLNEDFFYVKKILTKYKPIQVF